MVLPLFVGGRVGHRQINLEGPASFDAGPFCILEVVHPPGLAERHPRGLYKGVYRMDQGKLARQYNGPVHLMVDGAIYSGEPLPREASRVDLTATR